MPGKEPYSSPEDSFADTDSVIISVRKRERERGGERERCQKKSRTQHPRTALQIQTASSFQ